MRLMPDAKIAWATSVRSILAFYLRDWTCRAGPSSTVGPYISVGRRRVPSHDQAALQLVLLARLQAKTVKTPLFTSPFDYTVRRR